MAEEVGGGEALLEADLIPRGGCWILPEIEISTRDDSSICCWREGGGPVEGGGGLFDLERSSLSFVDACFSSPSSLSSSSSSPDCGEGGRTIARDDGREDIFTGTGSLPWGDVDLIAVSWGPCGG